MQGGKAVENRTQQCSYRGPLAIHAGMRWSVRGAHSPLVTRARDPHNPPESLNASTFETGVILGVVDLVDVHPSAGCCAPWGESSYVEHGGRERRQIVHLVLENPRLLPEPIPCKGALGLWTPPADITARLRAVV